MLQNKLQVLNHFLCSENHCAAELHTVVLCIAQRIRRDFSGLTGAELAGVFGRDAGRPQTW